MRMRYSKEKLSPLSVEEFDAARTFLQTQMQFMAERYPQRAEEERADYISRLRTHVLELADRPEFIVRMQQDGRDSVLETLSNLDMDHKRVDIMRAQLVSYNSGQIRGSGFNELAEKINPDEFRRIQRSLLEERLRTDKQRQTALNLH